ncbi:MAG TPA: SRPBCC family protein [Steroidobacteraceae bacterium]|jgi:uncharacterized membrane protein|nr:SRPBCC family protein [Steroidobacteraceae bacterium]
MAEPLSHTAHGDAPLSSAKHPNAGAAPEFDAHKGDVLVGRTVTIDRSRQELYAFWRDFSNLPRFMQHIRSVTVSADDRSHWVVEAPAGKTVEWDAQITEDQPGGAIAWKSLEHASVKNSGRVEFADSPEGRGTIVRVTLAYDPPGGTIGKAIAKLFQQEPKIQARRDLRRFKQLMETGEVSTAQPQLAAPRA